MKKFWFPVYFLVGMVMAVSLSCNISSGAGDDPANSATRVAQTVEAANNPDQQTEAPAEPGAPPEPGKPAPTKPAGAAPAKAPPIPSEPKGLIGSLASFDTYHLDLIIKFGGKLPKDNSLMETHTDFDRATNAYHSITKSMNISAGSSAEVKTTPDTSESWRVGDLTCTKSEDKYNTTKKETTDQDMMNKLMTLVDISPVVYKPAFVDSGKVNGIDSNHFKFSMPAFDAKTGKVLTKNEGEYWLAKDGQYLVKYSLVLEYRNAPEGDPAADVSTSSFFWELKDINKQIDIQLPAECPAPKAEGS